MLHFYRFRFPKKISGDIPCKLFDFDSWRCARWNLLASGDRERSEAAEKEMEKQENCGN